MILETKISNFIESQFPDFYLTEGPNFISFVRAYYEWLEQEKGVLNYSRNMLSNQNIDLAAEEFISHFKKTYIESIPETMLADKRLLIKHILELYRSKGTPKSYVFLFRLLFNEDIDIYIPGDHLFTTSEGSWVTPKYIEVADHPYLQYLVNKKIYNNSGSAIVELLSTKQINRNIINVLYISNLEGNFNFNQNIYCDDLYISSIDGSFIDLYTYENLSDDLKSNYSLAITSANAPLIVGSLSIVSVTNGGTNYNVGDLLDINSTAGKNGIAKVNAITNQNGKVTFNIINGGFGFSMNAAITVSSNLGYGATFSIGSLANKSIYRINKDKIGDYYNTQLDITVAGFSLNVSNTSGNMTNNEGVTASANSVLIDLKNTLGSVYVGETLTNTSLGINNLTIYRSEPSFVAVTGPDTSLTNANLMPGVILSSNSGGLVTVNSIQPKTNITLTANVFSSNSTVLVLNNINGYVIPGETITGLSSSKTAKVTSTNRLTNWMFPAAPFISNLDIPIGTLLTTFDLEVGTITSLKNVNPGFGYSSNPSIDIVEPYIYDLKIPDNNGGYYGYDAVINGTANTAKGIVVSVEIEDSGFGYYDNETVEMSNSNNDTSVFGVTIVDSSGKSAGYWNDNKSFLSDTNYIIDSDYYQKYTYEIISTKMLSSYKEIVNNLVHPQGTKLFGRFKNYNYMGNTSSFTSTSISQDISSESSYILLLGI